MLAPPEEIGGVIAIACGPSADDLMAALTPAELAVAAAMSPRRAREWALGRSCLRQAVRGLDASFTGDLLINKRGAPHVADELRVSLSHKHDVAVAWAQRANLGPVPRWHLGIDIELLAPPRQPIEARVLTPRERAALPVEPCQRLVALKTIFALKEAAYKAIDPFVGRYVGFAEAEAEMMPDGLWRVTVAAHAEINIAGRVQHLPDHVVATAWAFMSLRVQAPQAIRGTS
ncbi:MAG: 4'-phosphopantetheinyl transferase superfamily protein [Myxococcales bacterium]|nr:4'-phosphopantetheinyl transferase superfamily protein [Myxococcales bacterium]